ncbi:protein mono-ADP-ribosyltransferase PARP14-like isoform X2 [Nelusetta ayraudi]|uniref:protein mono-ADP-ribosyltransferase PARP14-like isoform X2 n=1 Tax=Nelusetta ayraudi TaxID=303726 RepID=UPI003F71283C
MAESVCPPITVEGDWSPAHTRIVTNKLQIYFGSKKKSGGGGECRVEADSAAPRAAVFFSSAEARERVLARKDHEVVVEKQILKLRLSSASISLSPDGSAGSEEAQTVPGGGASSGGQTESEADSRTAIVFGNIQSNMSRDLLSMFVENVSGLNESKYSLEIIWEANAAVATFNVPADVQTFQSSQRLQSQGLTARPLEAALSVRVEELPPSVVGDMLEMYFEETWSQPDKVIMIAGEQAAIVSFTDPEVVKRICTKQHHDIKSAPVKVYPYYLSLGSALYGMDRPTCQPPKAFTEKVQHAILQFLLLKKLLKGINDQMTAYFCSVDLEGSEVKLRPLPSFMRQPGVNSNMVDKWKKSAQEAFRQLLSHYVAFECTVNTAAWKAAEKDVRLLVKEDAALVVDATGDLLTVAGPADFIKQIRAPLEKIVNKIMSQIQRQTEAVQKDMDLSPPMYHMLQQEGLEKARQDFSPDMSISYNGHTQKLAIEGLPEEFLKLKDWILEKKMNMSKKQIDLSAGLLDFLNNWDPLEISQDLFMSQGINAILSIENTGVSLLASSPSALNDAETKIRTSLSQQTVVVDDQEVIQRPEWVTLNQQLLDTYNTSKKKTVTIQNHAVGGASILVSGFQNPVDEVSRNLQEFIFNYSRVQETFRLKSAAVLQFITMKKVQEFTTIKEENFVKIDFDPKRQKMTISGARIHVQNAKSHLQKLTSVLATDRYVIDKPGAKKYFLTQGSIMLSSLMIDLNCVVLPMSENQEEDEDDEDSGEEAVVCHYKVQTTSGVLVSVRKANICRLSVDAVVNAANETLQHEGGLALALLKAAGTELQKISNDCITARGPLRPGDAVVTGGCNLPCKYVVHAVGPRFLDHDKKTSVRLLRRAVRQSLREAAKVNCTSVALPAISSGVFDFPVRLCADTIAEAVREYCDSVEGPGSLNQIDLVDNNASTVRELTTAVQLVFSDLKPILTAVQQEGGAEAVVSGFQEGEGPSHFPEGQGHSGRGGHFAERRGEEEAGGARWAAAAKSQRGRSQRPMGSRGDLKQTTAEGLKIVLWKGNIEDQTTCVIVNTIAENLNLKQGAVSKALLQAAGPSLQSAVMTAGGSVARFGDIVITDGFKLSCQKVFHAVCPFWDKGAGNAENDLTSIIRFCMDEAEKLHMQSLSFPAIGTGNLNFPRDLVCMTLLKEIHRFSSRRASRHLKEVLIVVHPTDAKTADSFSRQFNAWRPLKDLQDRDELPRAVESYGQSQQSPVPSVAFSRVSSPSLGVYHMQMGPVALEVSSGDITKDASDAIVNSSNQNFTLKSGVSKAILDSAGPTVQSECDEILKTAGNRQCPMILTSAGQLPSKNIIHVAGTNDATKIKEVVYSVLKLCEENKFSSVAFPALGTGQGGASPSAVADAMVDAAVDFVRKKQPKLVRNIKILIFQTAMMTEFHGSMKKREGEQLQEKTILTYLKDKVLDFSGKFLGWAEEQPAAESVVLQKEEFEPTVFLLCADNDMALSQAKQRINELIVAEHAVKTIKDHYISQLSQADMDKISALQRQLTVSISLEMGGWDQEPSIRLEGLTRDVFTADAELRGIIQRVQRGVEKKLKAKMISQQLQWYFQQDDGTMVAFDLDTNLLLEEALINNKQHVKIKISNKPYHADVFQQKANSADGRKVVELQRQDMKAAVPPEWENMQGNLVKTVKLPVGSPEFIDVEAKTNKTGLQANIISIERIQNTTLWQGYQLMKKQLEVKNNHKNNERQLFHGTNAKSVDWINNRGFDRGFAGTHAAMFGKGTYFAVDPKYSANGYAAPDTSGHKRMYLARVLVGDFTPGKAGLITPPNKSSVNSTDLYDSVTDRATNPTMFVVFTDNQAYPEYLITFQ